MVPLRLACQDLQGAIVFVEDDLVLLSQIPGQLDDLLNTLSNIEAPFRAKIEHARGMEAASRVASSAASTLNGTGAGDVNGLTEPTPGIGKTDSSSSGRFAPAAARARGRTARHSNGPQGPTQPKRSGRRWHVSLTDRLCPGFDDKSTELDKRWRRLRRMTAMEILGHETTVWTLVLSLALAGSVATAIAVWKAGPGTQSPEVDSNFWSTLSQNVIAAAGLYCIIIPILRKVELKTDNPKTFRFWLVLSAVGALVSTAIYPFQLRTSMVLACISSLAQLLATLQLIEETGSAVKGLQEELEVYRLA
ncbi:hypothetical protein LTR85_004394 [Meristemomyces frigidus]|nr:hypothetical protein LTR85_004394 [Meristemomyces frigidus]